MRRPAALVVLLVACILALGTGCTGKTGPMGPEGPAGADGKDGEIGLQGPEGPQGSGGAEGPAGPQGPEGAEGPAGPQGPAGMSFTLLYQTVFLSGPSIEIIFDALRSETHPPLFQAYARLIASPTEEWYPISGFGTQYYTVDFTTGAVTFVGFTPDYEALLIIAVPSATAKAPDREAMRAYLERTDPGVIVAAIGG